MKTRTQQAWYNSVSTIGIFSLRFIFQFINRMIFLRFLGVYYLGLNGIFTSILGMLSLAELGIGTSIIYALYKPIAENRQGKIAAYMQLYRKIYRLIAFVIFLLGLLVLPFLPTILQETGLTGELISIYLLFLLNSVIGYLLFSYKRSLLVAYQENYVISWIDFGIFILSSIAQWLVLWGTQNYLLVLVMIVLATIVSNLFVAQVVDKRHPLGNAKIEGLTSAEKSSLKKNVIGNLAGNIAGVIVFSTDNILMSSFISVTAVGLYSNYTIITKNLDSLLLQLMSSQNASVGNLVHSADSDKVYQIFKRYNFLNFVLAFLLSLLVNALIQPFLRIWLGEEYLLSSWTVMLLSIYMFIQMYRYAGFIFYNAYGLYWESRYKPIAEAILNLVFSLLFLIVFKWGIEGILLGTICSTLLTNTWFEPYIIFKYGLKRSIREYLWINIKQWGLFLVSLTVIFGLKDSLLMSSTFWSWFALAALLTIALLFLLIATFFKTPEFRWWWKFLTAKIVSIVRLVSR
ncbi:transporter [Streptococcus pneumoniae]